MTGWRVYSRPRRGSRSRLVDRRRWIGMLACAAVGLAGCSGIENPTLAPPAEPRTLELGWVERYPSARFTFRVGRLRVGEDGWRAEIAVTNGSESPYRLGRGSVGLVLLDTASRAEVRRLTDDLTRAPPALRPDREAPEAPSVLGPGASWAATIAGSEVLRASSVVRVLFGPYSLVGVRDITRGGTLLWVTEHAARL
jgi:hypothetical protein